MKIKCQPEDFIVTEQTSVQPSSGPFALYRLSKTGLGTLEAIAQIRRTWNLAAGQVTHAGLKDRHAVTHQVITIRNGPQADLSHDRFSLTCLGRTSTAVSAADIECNQFQIVIRHLKEHQARQLSDRVHHPGGVVVPNYFDSQRFGSLGYSGEYMAAAWCRRDYERATWLALADPNPHDRSDEKSQKTILRDHWGDWQTCKQQLSRSHRRSIVTYLVDHPDGFKKAFGLIRPELRGLCLSAFQSAVWNRMLGQMIEQRHPGLATTEIADATLPLGCLTSDEVEEQQTLPLVSARSKKLSAVEQQLAETATQQYDMSLADMKLSWPRDRFFSRGQRRCWLNPGQLTASMKSDELYPEFQSVQLTLELPAGSYATMLISGLTQGLQEPHR